MGPEHIAKEIAGKLARSGYIAYFAGGCVRDQLMGHPSDDIDIATDAPPEVILNLFPRTILVGLAFGVVVVVERGYQFEVATFRLDMGYVNGRKPTHIELATPEEDASRRDFTINGMFYDPFTAEVHDFVGGAKDIKDRLIRTIGDPYERFVEDRLRMIRAVRFAARFDFVIDPDTEEAIKASADTLFPAVAMERISQEFAKMAKYPRFDRALMDMQRLGILEVIFPSLKGLHLNEIKRCVSAFAHYPKKCPAIICLLALFPLISSIDAIELCKYLKLSQAETLLADFLVKIRHLVHQQIALGRVNQVEWVHHYANPSISLCLEVVAAHLNPLERGLFLEHHHAQMERFKVYIKALQDKKPLVTSLMLQQEGVLPGKWMGKLLKEAENIAIEHELIDPLHVLLKLKSSKVWIEYVETVY